MSFQVKSINKIVFLILIALCTGVFLPLLEFKYSISIIIFFLAILIFFLLFSPIEVWKIIFAMLFLGPLLPYSYYFNKFMEPHFGGASPYFVITPTYMAFFFSVLLLVVFYKRKISVDFKLEKSLFIWILFIVYSFIISIRTATNLNATFYELVRMVIAAGISIIVYLLIDSKEKLKSALIIIGIVLLIESAIAFLQEFAILPRDLLFGETIGTSNIIYVAEIFRRPAGTLREPNTFAKLLSLFIPIFLILSVILKERKEKLFFFLVLTFSMLALFMTLGRSAIVGTILGSFLGVSLIGIFAKEHLPSKKFIISGVSVVVVLIAVIGGLLFQVLYLRFIVFGYLTVTGRVAQYQNALYTIKNHFLWGVGLNNYCYATVMEDISGIAATNPEFPVHNLYLLYFSETGLFGFMLFLTFIISVFARGVRNLTLPDLDNFSLAVIVGGLGGFASILLQSLLGWGVRSITLFSLFFLLGLIVAGRNNGVQKIPQYTNNGIEEGVSHSTK